MKKIYISGCARSGTTLLLRLFYAFESTVVIPSEINVEQFVNMGKFVSGNSNLIGKRTFDTIFSNKIDIGQEVNQLKSLKANDVKIIVIIRDGRDVIESGYTEPERWMSSLDQVRRYESDIDLIIKYEDLVKDPDKIQNVISEKFGLKIKDQFKSYPDFVPKEGFEHAKSSGKAYDPRPIDTSNIGKNPELYKTKCQQNIIPIFEKYLRKFEYLEPDTSIPEIPNLTDVKNVAKVSDSAYVSEFPKGVIGIASSFLGRYREFDVSVNNTIAPIGSAVEWFTGVNIAFHYNNMCRKIIEEKDLEWLWIHGDDHVFRKDLLIQLLKRNVDVIVPLCLRRSKPFMPVIHGLREELYKPKGFEFLNGKKGIIDITDVANVGNAGMLIKRHVLEGCSKPWFVNGAINPEMNSSDLYFCENLRSSGYRIHIDLDNHIGHITHTVIWPKRDENGNYKEELVVPGK